MLECFTFSYKEYSTMERYAENYTITWEDAAEWVKAFETEWSRNVVVLMQCSLGPTGRLRWYVNLKSFTNLTSEWKAASEVAGDFYPSGRAKSVPALILNLVRELEEKAEAKANAARAQSSF